MVVGAVVQQCTYKLVDVYLYAYRELLENDH